MGFYMLYIYSSSSSSLPIGVRDNALPSMCFMMSFRFKRQGGMDEGIETMGDGGGVFSVVKKYCLFMQLTFSC